MTLFINLRQLTSGGDCAAEASLWEDGTHLLQDGEFASRVKGRNVILATHGFNVNQTDGIEALSRWSDSFQLASSYLFIGVLWPGDSRFIPVIDYPIEGGEAITAGQRLATFINQNGAGSASYSFVSHSLGARMVLEALDGLNFDVRQLILMAGAIENDCLINEYQQAANKAKEIYALSSEQDWVLELAFPIGNPVGEIVMHGHPYFKTALGRDGPSQPIPAAQQGGAWQIPDDWDYGHLDYLPGKKIGPAIPLPIDAPGPSDPIPVDPEVDGWKPSWSASVVSTQMT